MENYENDQKVLTKLLHQKPYLSDNKNAAYEKGILAAKSIAKEVHESGGGRIEILNRLDKKLKVKPFDLTRPKYIDAYYAGIQVVINYFKPFA